MTLAEVVKTPYLDNQERQELRRQCQNFATALLDHTRSSYELEAMLNYDPTGPAFEHGDRMHLSRLKLAIKYKQKKVGVAETSRNITARVIERDVNGEIHYFLEESRGFRTHQHGRQIVRQLGSTAKISPSSH
ncbi:transient receptor potential-gamma protein [Trichonephila clavipes]|nr:transient receptor potential-gamma protein [Trichonephila clavipes]